MLQNTIIISAVMQPQLQADTVKKLLLSCNLHIFLWFPSLLCIILTHVRWHSTATYKCISSPADQTSPLYPARNKKWFHQPDLNIPRSGNIHAWLLMMHCNESWERRFSGMSWTYYDESTHWSCPVYNFLLLSSHCCCNAFNKVAPHNTTTNNTTLQLEISWSTASSSSSISQLSSENLFNPFLLINADSICWKNLFTVSHKIQLKLLKLIRTIEQF